VALLEDSELTGSYRRLFVLLLTVLEVNRICNAELVLVYSLYVRYSDRRCDDHYICLSMQA